MKMGRGRHVKLAAVNARARCKIMERVKDDIRYNIYKIKLAGLFFINFFVQELSVGFFLRSQMRIRSTKSVLYNVRGV